MPHIKPITLTAVQAARFHSIAERTIVTDTGCREWPDTRIFGYGRFYAGRTPYQAHRVMWLITTGTDPGPLHVLHSCDNPPCIEFSHLFLGTNADNIRDRNAKGRANFRIGSACPRARLTEGDVRRIKELLMQGWTHQRIGDTYGVHRITVTDIAVGRTWRHVA